MAISLSGAITGGAQTGLTSPTHTWTAAQAPTPQGKQYICSTLGGTQPGVEVHSGSNPFLINFIVPASYRTARYNPTTGILSNPGKNVHKTLLHKGVSVDNAGLNKDRFEIEVQYRVPIGADIYDPESIRSALSALIGAMNNQSSGQGDTLITGAS